MNDQTVKLDDIDNRLLALLQRDASLSQRELADRVGLSQNACWRRLQRLTESGVLRGSRALIDAAALGLGLTVFVMIRTRHHDDVWARRFRARIESLPQICEFHRIGGEWDYMAKAVVADMAGYDRLYKQLIADMDLERVTGVFSMETIFEGRPLSQG
ncbi:MULTISPECIES: Lrp/AsnC family transcriptional regulator [unclassified Paracoccus (in: a-proteobacteria)]|uniref:Lrp/AsnC family transcriptional regulator n=1 Tax=unclassified Paracoccus (in: a-proteobacteria) TaxID=2688777 RepID=UPI0012B3BA94|nr:MULTISPECIES: Lrp/AsnC family transcriptional regulator [unclassified Paracoccus (in: a-proteobacteria)]UXU75483.1 Lrp/AsnC family transcriptional regulator [Paracoccus sp. SMMA_5]UXU81388.1 Lrp/AsnC family transcriptional regulator [Paracoccus sp. SMMA_5_TC]